MSDNPTKTYTIRLDPDFWPPVDAWRRKQPDIPTRAEAVRRLVGAGLDDAIRFNVGDKMTGDNPRIDGARRAKGRFKP
jgi:hypothetical protein